MGEGQTLKEPLPETGPREVRQTTAAFNQMHDRLLRGLSDRRRMLAALSHDLRSPLTSLRLRAEMVDDPEVREKLIATCEDMRQMAEQVLALMREEEAEEARRPVDLAALLSALTEDRADAGANVRLNAPERLVLSLRSLSVKRALANLIDNALAYGGCADISLTQDSGGGARIRIVDAGPGIPEDLRAKVLEPFHRLEQSRSRETGGAGLGLSIAASAIRGHAGTLTLGDRDDGQPGLKVTVSLPG